MTTPCASDYKAFTLVLGHPVQPETLKRLGHPVQPKPLSRGSDIPCNPRFSWKLSARFGFCPTLRLDYRSLCRMPRPCQVPVAVLCQDSQVYFAISFSLAWMVCVLAFVDCVFVYLQIRGQAVSFLIFFLTCLATPCSKKEKCKIRCTAYFPRYLEPEVYLECAKFSQFEQDMILIRHKPSCLCLESHIGLHVHRDHKGLLWTGKLGGRESANSYSLHCHHQNDCIKVGSYVSHFSISLILWAMTQDSAQERRAEADRTEVLLLTSLAPYR